MLVLLAGSRLWRAQWQGNLHTGALVRTSLHYVERTTDFYGPAGAADVAEAISDHMTQYYMPCLATDTHIDVLEVREVVRFWSPFNEIPSVSAAIVDDGGTVGVGSERLPSACCSKISIKSNAAVRGGHGWILPPANVSVVNLNSDGQWDGDLGAGITALADHIPDTIEFGSLPTHILDPIVYSETRHRRGDDNYYFDVENALWRSDPTWLRRRISIP